MMPSVDLQEVIALAIVAVVIAIGAWRWVRRRGTSRTACGHCDRPAAPTPKEIPLRFHRRKR
jgi:hypothetical protein